MRTYGGGEKPSRNSRKAPPMVSPVRETAADIAAVASLLEIGDRLGVIHLLEGGDAFTVDDLAAAARVPAAGAQAYVEALVAAAVVIPTGASGKYVAASDFEERRYESGYLSWALNANRPFIEHAAEFMRSP